MSQKRNQREIKKHHKSNESGKTHQNLWDAAKAVVRGTFIVINASRKNLKLPNFPQGTRKRKIS